MTPLPIEVPAGAFWCDCTRAVVRADSPVCKKDCPYRPNIPLTAKSSQEKP
jgi:hypothetical protein